MIGSYNISIRNLSQHIRPFDPRRDLKSVADLVELCFADTLDNEGRNYINQMRRVAQSPNILRWTGALESQTPIPLSGFVWVENDQVVGNLTQIPYYPHGKLYYLIANVAVHPEYRRQGIARNLTMRAIEYARKKEANYVWLHVREENEEAFQLYQSLGFNERSRRTTWICDRDKKAENKVNDIKSSIHQLDENIINKRSKQDWVSQKVWLERLYPPELNWHLSINMQSFGPDLWSSLYRFFTATRITQWSVKNNKTLLGVISWQMTTSFADNLWLAVPPQFDSKNICKLLSFVRKRLSPHRPTMLDFPIDQSDQVFFDAGFDKHQTLIWMSLPLNI